MTPAPVQTSIPTTPAVYSYGVPGWLLAVAIVIALALIVGALAVYLFRTRR